MIRRVSGIAVLLLSACVGATDSNLDVNEVGATQAAVTPPDLSAVAEALDARAGEKLSGDLTILGASATGQRLDMRFRHDRASDEFTQAEREGYAIVAERTIREQMCAAPATARFVETYDGVGADIVTADDAPLAQILVTEC